MKAGASGEATGKAGNLGLEVEAAGQAATLGETGPDTGLEH